MEGRYPAGVFLNLADCMDPAKEQGFIKWNQDVLLPGLKNKGCIQHFNRYENVMSRYATFQGRPKYLTLSEVYNDNLEGVLKEIHEFEEELATTNRDNDSRVSKVNTMYRMIGSEFRTERTGREVQAILCVLCGCTDLSREAEFNEWYNERHSPETIINNIFSFDTGYRYQVVDPNDPMPHQSSPYLSIYETSASIEDTLKGLAGLRKESTATDQTWVELLTVYYAGVFKPLK